jgi:hypothetical protein
MNTEPTKMFLTASAGEAVLAPEAASAVRAFASGMSTEIASLVDSLPEPFKGQFLEIKGQVNQMLASLQPTDQVPAAQDSNYALRSLFYALQTAQSMIAQLGATAKNVGKELATTRASIPEETKKAIDAQIASGALFDKEGAAKLANDAAAAAKALFKTEAKAISDRRTSLASASIPVPSDDVLVGDEAAYNAKFATAKARFEKLKAFSLSSTSIADIAWNHSDSAFDATLEILNQATKGATTSPAPKGGNPFAGGAAKSAGSFTERLTKSGAF